MLAKYAQGGNTIHAEYTDLKRVATEDVELVVSMCSKHVQDHVNLCKSKCNDKCGVCLDNLVPYNLTILKCNHCYHNECIESWKKVHPSCPMCRTPC
jgi:hypothetical protein